MSSEMLTVIGVILAALLTASPGIWALRGQYVKQSADASAVNVETALKLMKKLELKVEELSNRVDEADKRELEYMRLLKKLIAQCERLDITPDVSLEEVNKIAQEVQE